MANAEQRAVGILIFDEVEVLDFCGPFEVSQKIGVPDAISRLRPGRR